MRRRPTLVALALAVALAGASLGAAHAGEPAASPRAVTPLLIGAEVPAVTLQTGDGTAFDLGAAFKDKPTILVLYRGGW